MLKFLLESDLQSESERFWRWIKRHPVLAIGALVVITVAFAPSHTPGHHPGDTGPDEPPLFI